MSQVRNHLTVSAMLLFAVVGGLIASTIVHNEASAESPEPSIDTLPNRLIDYPGFRNIVDDAERIREGRRLTEAAFLNALRESGTVLLDARSSYRFDERHIEGAVSLPFTDWTAETLAAIVPTKNTKVLIYCNNNFVGDPSAFATKVAPASLNLASYTSLLAYGYTNIWELGPLLDVNATSLPFAGSFVPPTPGAQPPTVTGA